MERQSV